MDATRDATMAATEAATMDATWAATRDATEAATWAATEDATRDATAPGSVVRFLLGTLGRWSRFWNAGNQWAGWASYLSFFREVAGLDLPEHARWIHYEQAAIHGGPRLMHAKFWIVADFPTRICRDPEYRSHSADGASIAWADGWAVYRWHGVDVPREWIEAPSTIDPKLAITHPNAEQRRCLAEIIGWDRVLRELDARTIDTDADPQIGELVEVTIEEEPARFLRCRCGTGRMFALRVPPETASAIAAQAWIHDLPESTMRQLEART